MTTDGVVLRCYLLFSTIAEPLYRIGIKHRLARGRENPNRYLEKFGLTEVQRPAGPVIWMHGVGLGEVLALRSLISALRQQHEGLSFLITSSTKTSAEVFAANLPDNTIHQFLPVDAQRPIQRFLDHWHPLLSVWAEQDLWPAIICHTHRRDIPLALVNARMNHQSYQARARIASLFKNIYRRFVWISAQDESTANHMRQLGALVSVDGSLKASLTPLADPFEARSDFIQQLNGRHAWLLASSHSEDESLALQAHKQLLQQQPDALLIIAPRFIDRKDDIIQQCHEHGLTVTARSDITAPGQSQVYVANTFGEMGIWYRVCEVALIGGSNSSIQGHNPWEAAALHCAIMHGPNTDNFRPDYQSLAEHHAAIKVENSNQILEALQKKSLQKISADNAHQLATKNSTNIEQLATRLLKLIENSNGS